MLQKESQEMVRVFLGGTCNGSTWRERLIRKLDPMKVSYFDPVVKDWNEEAQRIEQEEKRLCDYHLYCLTPLMRGTYSVAEVVDSAHRNPWRTIFCVLPEDGATFSLYTQATEPLRFGIDEMKSLEAVGKLIVSIGGMWAPDLESVAEILHNRITSAPGSVEVEV